ncbi:uncharacterized protein LOC6737565 [Drosophila simulans]|uniref:Uncharacterized protein n=2 Tax=Drosophila simulans TaxID=7240 RepID=A0A0J9UIP3_DROSI|nr:uncharacterized protein LOC6737565 [Drosophila simulans]KMY98865.1 uncharacterized protein Dsimw501_GD14253 [Drosophila simulans]
MHYYTILYYVYSIAFQRDCCETSYKYVISINRSEQSEMKPQTGRIVKSSSPSWLCALMPLMIDAVCGRAQYASPYGSAYAITTSNYPQPDVQSIWSGPPIIVNDNQYSAQEQQQYPKSNGYYGAEPSFRQPYPNWRREEPTRAPNHNYNNVPGYFYYQQQETTPSTSLPYPQSIPAQLQPYPQRNPELETSDSRREEEQVVQIGGSRSLATNNYLNTYNNNENFYEPAQPWRRRDYQAKYAQHFAEYLRKYPRRLQPVYNTNEDFVEK